MSKQPSRANSAIETSEAQQRHREIASQSVTEQRSPAQVLKDSQAAALAGTSNGVQPSDVGK
jgi:hypothetical protein